MKAFLQLFVISFFCLVLVTESAKKKPKVAQQTAPSPPPTAQPPAEEKPPIIDWGKCPQLEPKESDKVSKAEILESCLKVNPIPKNLTAETVEKHQKSMAECALKKENWFSKSGSYRYSKAESEIKTKKLLKSVETDLIKHHKKCESEAKTQFKEKSKLIDQIQMYQACMDYHITQTCGIELKAQTA